ncbi:MAG: hypothetical protein AAF346_00275 [Pseudomonadota bacterium]
MEKDEAKRHLYTATVELSASELAAVEAWREANRVGNQREALRELIKYGLLGEIRRIYQSSERNRDRVSSPTDEHDGVD